MVLADEKNLAKYYFARILWRRKPSELCGSRSGTFYRQHPSIVQITHPPRPDKARQSGYRPSSDHGNSMYRLILVVGYLIFSVRRKHGPAYVVYCVRVSRGGHKRPVAILCMVNPQTSSSLNWNYNGASAVSEECAGRKLGVLTDSTYKYYEVILVDVAHNPRISWICNPVHKNRELRGLTSAGKKCRGLNGKGHLHHKARPSRRANWKKNNTGSLPRYR
ncbi:hypothetical protein ACFX2B_001681 [Malus domestica]